MNSTLLTWEYRSQNKNGTWYRIVPSLSECSSVVRNGHSLSERRYTSMFKVSLELDRYIETSTLERSTDCVTETDLITNINYEGSVPFPEDRVEMDFSGAVSLTSSSCSSQRNSCWNKVFSHTVVEGSIHGPSPDHTGTFRVPPSWESPIGISFTAKVLVVVLKLTVSPNKINEPIRLRKNVPSTCHKLLIEKKLIPIIYEYLLTFL